MSDILSEHYKEICNMTGLEPIIPDYKEFDGAYVISKDNPEDTTPPPSKKKNRTVLSTLRRALYILNDTPRMKCGVIDSYEVASELTECIKVFGDDKPHILKKADL